MCKPRKARTERRVQDEPRAYEGETIRLNTVEASSGTRSAHWHHHHFPWWTLWLIWPLFGLVKWLAIGLVSTLAAVAGALGEIAVPVLHFWPLLLILVGLVLLRQRRG